MELRQIRGFVEVARTGSFARAAGALNVGKPALSKQIRQLEAELGADLFVRGGGRREARMTPAGEAFLPDAVTAIQAADNGAESVRRLSGPDGGHVSVMVADGWETWPDWEYLVTAFRQQHPTVSTRIVGSSSVREMLDAVATGASDLAVVTYVDAPPPGDVRIEPLLQAPLHVYLTPDHPYSDAGELTLHDLRDENWLLPPIDRAFMTDLLQPLG